MRYKLSLLIALLFLSLVLPACATKQKAETTSDAGAAPAAKAKYFEAQEQLKEYENSTRGDAERGKDTTYKIFKETYIVNDGMMDIAINYPQISNMGDDDRQKKINELIKKELLQILASFSKDRGLILALNYKITWKSDKLLSIQYTGMGYGKGAAHPNHGFYTLNIDIARGIKLRLKDLVTIDEKFVDKYRNETIKTVGPHPGALSGKQIFVDFTPLKTVDDTIKLFGKADIVDSQGILPDTYCYFTPDAFGISEEVSFGKGGHAEFEIRYEDIANNIKADNEVWGDFFPR